MGHRSVKVKFDLKKYQVLDGVPELRNGEILLWKSSDGNKSGSCVNLVIEGTLEKCCSGPYGVAAVAWYRVRLWGEGEINSPFTALRKQRKFGCSYRYGESDLFRKFGPYLHDLPLLSVGDRVLSGFCYRGVCTWPYVLGSDNRACWHFLWWIYGKVFVKARYTSRERSRWECPWSHFLWWIYGKVFKALYTSRERSRWECSGSTAATPVRVEDVYWHATARGNLFLLDNFRVLWYSGCVYAEYSLLPFVSSHGGTVPGCTWLGFGRHGDDYFCCIVVRFGGTNVLPLGCFFLGCFRF